MPHVLIVEDDFVDQMLVKRTLQELTNTTFRCVGSGYDGLAYLNAYDVDLVVSDVRMPGLDGHEFRNEVRRTRPQLPFIMMSGVTDDPVTARGTNHDGTRVLCKDDIATRLVSLCRDRLVEANAERN